MSTRGPKPSNQNKDERQLTKDKILELLKDTDPRVGRTVMDLADELNEHYDVVQAILNGMNRNRRAQKRSGIGDPRWTIYTGLIAPEDANGAKTDTERKVVQFLQEADEGQSLGTIALAIQIPVGRTATMCAALYRRQVIQERAGKYIAR